jgi:hypothetical protein
LYRWVPSLTFFFGLKVLDGSNSLLDALSISFIIAGDFLLERNGSDFAAKHSNVQLVVTVFLRATCPVRFGPTNRN